ncbi:MAG: hypothetical protein M3P51_00815 [Chloroflexota bacterium]|nr:hypothetical protein [Chloroflexota bacterium]
MVKLWISRVLDQPGNPVLATYRAAKQALVERLAAERGIQAFVECADEEEVELSFTGPLDEMVALIEELWREGVGNLSLEAETDDEAEALEALPAVASVDLAQEPRTSACPPLHSHPRLGRIVVSREVDATARPELINEALEGHVNFLAEQERVPMYRRENASMLEVPDTATYLKMDTLGGDTPITVVTLEKYSESS